MNKIIKIVTVSLAVLCGFSCAGIEQKKGKSKLSKMDKEFLKNQEDGIYAKFETNKGPCITVKTRWLMAFSGGILMGYGAMFARGCTSGQGLSGGAMLSVGSWAFLLAVFAGAYGVAYLLRRLWI